MIYGLRLLLLLKVFLSFLTPFALHRRDLQPEEVSRLLVRHGGAILITTALNFRKTNKSLLHDG